MAAFSAGTAIALTSLAAGLYTGTTQAVARGDTKGAVAGLTTGNANNATKKPPAPPAPLFANSAPKAMPTINQEKVQKSRLSALQSLQARTGRASTMLTSQGTGQNNTFG